MTWARYPKKETKQPYFFCKMTGSAKKKETRSV